MKILVYGWSNFANVGDEMYKVAFPALFPGHDFAFANRLDADVLRGADLLVLGGGNILDRNFLKEVQKYRGAVPMQAWSVGCTDDAVTREQLAVFDRIWVRDHRSQDRLASKGVKSDYAPDASWVLKADRTRGVGMWEELFAAQHNDLYERRVAVVLNGHLTTTQPDLYAKDFLRWQTFATDMVEVADGAMASFAFLPFGRSMPWDDRVPNGWVAHRCKWHKKNAVVWDGGWGVQETLDFVAAADAVVSMRLHATVFGIIAGTPVLDVTHHDKNRGFLEAVGKSAWSVPYWDFPREAARGLLGDMLSDRRHSLRAECSLIAEVQRRELMKYCQGLMPRDIQ